MNAIKVQDILFPLFHLLFGKIYFPSSCIKFHKYIYWNFIQVINVNFSLLLFSANPTLFIAALRSIAVYRCVGEYFDGERRCSSPFLISLDDKKMSLIERVLKKSLNTEDFDEALEKHDEYYNFTTSTLSFHSKLVKVYMYTLHLLIISESK